MKLGSAGFRFRVDGPGSAAVLGDKTDHRERPADVNRNWECFLQNLQPDVLLWILKFYQNSEDQNQLFEENFESFQRNFVFRFS